MNTEITKKAGKMHRIVTVKAEYDHEAGVWFVAESSLDGLSAEAETVEKLADKLPGMIADLIECNGDSSDDDLPIELTAHLYQTISSKRLALA